MSTYIQKFSTYTFSYIFTYNDISSIYIHVCTHTRVYTYTRMYEHTLGIPSHSDSHFNYTHRPTQHAHNMNTYRRDRHTSGEHSNKCGTFAVSSDRAEGGGRDQNGGNGEESCRDDQHGDTDDEDRRER